MTNEQRAYFEHRLLDERQRVTRSLGQFDERMRETVQDQSGDLSKIPFHAADTGTDTMERELEGANAARESAELSEIDAALRRLYEEPERFGICEDTGKEIPFARLDLIPWARTCGDLPDREAASESNRSKSV